MSNLHPLRNSLPRKGRHWSQNVHECVLLRGSSGNFNLHIVGGAENGEFICIGEVRQDRLRYHRGKIHQGDVVLEINGKPVAGYTQFDVLPLIKSSNEAVTLHTVKQGDQITRDLQNYLSTRFDKNSIDSDLQQTIRDNLYNRTVPCTTRSPKNGEIPGVDYVFLSIEEFIKLERSGSLLESGIYEGNHYGTPKPPREPLPPDNMIYVPNKSKTLSNGGRSRSEDNLGPLPPNWEIAFTEDNVKYFINHSTGTTQWVDPRLAQVKKATVDECDDDELPYGWERVDDPKYGTYYIDHVNRKTQFENPVQARRRQSHSSSISYSTAPPPHEGPPSFQSAAALAKAQEAEAHSRWPEVEFSQPSPPAYTDDDPNYHPRTHPYSIDGKQLQGEVITTELHKGSRGFGFTIVGGDQIGELLQIKSIVPDGAAAKDGVLRMGDALTRVNGMSVLSRSHQDVVSMFQAMPPGESIELEVVRGYPLPFDPDDPNVETIGSYTVVHGPSPGSESPVPRSSEENSPVFPTYPPPPSQAMNKWSNSQEPPESPFAPATHTTSTFPRTSTTNTLPRSSPELLTVPVVKGPMGFGFTIADSPYGQKVKQILDAPRCQGLLEGDILVEINGRMIRSCTHNEAVNILKECPKGQEAFIRVQRGGIPTPLRNSPAFGRREQEPEPLAQRVARPKSTPVMGSNHVGYRQVEHGSTGNLATTGESTRNQETGYENRRLGQPTLDKSSEALFNSYPSLKKAVANAARRSMENLSVPDVEPPPASPDAINFTVHLQRGEMGFGFRIIGGQEEGTQVAIGTIVRGGAADLNGDLRRGDEIHYVDRINVIGSTHRRVISLMGNAALAGEVTLGIHRNPARSERLSSSGMMRRSRSASTELSEASLGGMKAKEGSKSMGNLNQYGRRPHPDREETSSMQSFHSTSGDIVTAGGKSSQRIRSVSESDANSEPQGPTYYRDITLEKEDNESFGFVILSSVQKTGPTIGRIIQGSPADRCRQLHVGDRLVAVNNISIEGVHHSDIVDTIKQSGRTVTLRIALQRPLDNTETKKLSRMSVPDIAKTSQNSYESETDGRRDAAQWNRDRPYSEQVLPDRTRDESRSQSYPRTVNHNSDIPKRNNSYGTDTNTRRDADQWKRDNAYSEQVLPDRTRDESRSQSYPRTVNHNSDIPKRNNTYGTDANTRRDADQWKRDNAYSEQVPPDRARVESRFQSFPRTQNHNSQLPPKVPPRVAPKPSRDKVLMARKENSVNAVRTDIRRRSNPEIPSRPPLPSQNYSGGMRDERDPRFQTMEVELDRGQQGYGFSIRGGRELNLPIFVLRMADGGPAERDGRLRVGDEILEINGRSTENIPHADAIALIKSGGNRVHLLIHRSNKPVYYDGIPNGGQNISKGGSLPRTTWKNPSYNAMYQ